MTDIVVTFQRHHVGAVLRGIGARIHEIERAQATIPLSTAETALLELELDELREAHALIDKARR